MSAEYDNYEYISNSQDYRHLQDRDRYKALYDEVGTVEANRVIQWREEWMKHFKPRPGATILELDLDRTKTAGTPNEQPTDRVVDHLAPRRGVEPRWTALETVVVPDAEIG